MATKLKETNRAIYGVRLQIHSGVAFLERPHKASASSPTPDSNTRPLISMCFASFTLKAIRTIKGNFGVRLQRRSGEIYPARRKEASATIHMGARNTRQPNMRKLGISSCLRSTQVTYMTPFSMGTVSCGVR